MRQLKTRYVRSISGIKEARCSRGGLLPSTLRPTLEECITYPIVEVFVLARRMRRTSSTTAVELTADLSMRAYGEVLGSCNRKPQNKVRAGGGSRVVMWAKVGPRVPRRFF